MDTSNFDNTENFKRGLEVRREVLGEDYVSASIEKGAAAPFTRKLQQFATEYAWGTVWCNDTLDRKTRSIMNICILSALGREAELRLHVRGAVNNGVSKDEIAEALLHTGVYAGAPTAVAGFRTAAEVFEQMGI